MVDEPVDSLSLVGLGGTGRGEMAPVQVIVDAFPDLDGVRYTSRFAGHPCAALFAPATSAMPGHPGISLPLTHPALVARLAGAAARLGYVVI